MNTLHKVIIKDFADFADLHLFARELDGSGE